MKETFKRPEKYMLLTLLVTIYHEGHFFICYKLLKMCYGLVENLK